MITESDIRRIIREELARALVLNTPAPVMTKSQIPTPSLAAVKEMSRQEQIDAMARNPQLAKEMFRLSRRKSGGRKRAA